MRDVLGYGLFGLVAFSASVTTLEDLWADALGAQGFTDRNLCKASS